MKLNESQFQFPADGNWKYFSREIGREAVVHMAKYFNFYFTIVTHKRFQFRRISLEIVAA